jgi:hypothetical protein
MTLEVGNQDRDDLLFALERTEGVLLEIRSALAPLDFVSVTAFDSSGHPIFDQHLEPDRTGLYHLSSLPTGTWDLEIWSSGTAAVRTSATAPGPPVTVTLPIEARLEVRVPELSLSNLAAELSLWRADGTRFDFLWVWGSPRRWRLEGGWVEVEHLPAGNWRVEVVASDGRTWSTQVTTREGEVTSLTLP